MLKAVEIARPADVSRAALIERGFGAFCALRRDVRENVAEKRLDRVLPYEATRARDTFDCAQCRLRALHKKQ